MRVSNSVTNIAAALNKAQSKMGSASKDSKNPFFRSTYADYSSVLEAVKEPLNLEGVTILQSTYSDATSHYVETLLLHTSGEFVSSGPLRLELVKLDPQAQGAAITYCRRFQLQALLAIPAVDDDAESTMNRPAKASLQAVQAPKAVEATPTPAAEVSKARTTFRKPPKPTEEAVATPTELNI